METSTKFDLETVAKNLELPANKVRSAVDLLEAGNTIPFITRYRKDETGGLSERQLRDIKQEVARQTSLAERKAVVLKAIENQAKLTDALREQIEAANQARQIEDLYHPFKPRKTSLAETARQQGLEPLARDILEGLQPDVDLASRATDFVRVDKGLTSVDDVITGVQHILAERFSEHLQLRSQLRDIFWRDGKIKTELIPVVEPPAEKKPVAKETETVVTEATQPSEETPIEPATVAETAPATAEQAPQPDPVENEPESAPAVDPTDLKTEPVASAPDVPGAAETEPTPTPASDETAATTPAVTVETGAPSEATEEVTTEQKTATMAAANPTDKPTDKPKKKRKKKKKKSKPDPFAEFANFSESLQKIPPHRSLAINRGERAGRLKVKVSCDNEKLNALAKTSLIPEGHPFAEFLNLVSSNAMNRLIIPSIEREIRRDLTERSESHAVDVFARNLRHLFLQPPVRGYRIMGIDPGFRSGCKVAVIDEMGQPLGHGVFSIVGNADRIKSNKQRLVDLIKEHQPQLIAIGNGRGCRSVEQFVSDAISGDLAGVNIQYSIVNQAGTSTYSTSDLGQQELPTHGPLIRSAISIARRLQDPLSELVKVDPAHVGVGLYQHDIKAKHLADSLESVVESCVNFVGVNANTASPSLLKYVSGLGQTTARKLVDHRNEKGPFKDRENLREVAGFGEITFVQSAGFLRVDGSDEPLDQTSIHPEDYELTNKILKKLGCSIEELIPPPRPPRFSKNTRPATAEPASETPADQNLAAETLAPESPVTPTTETTEVATETPPPETVVEVEKAASLTAEIETPPADTESQTTADAETAAVPENTPVAETAAETESAPETEAASVTETAPVTEAESVAEPANAADAAPVAVPPAILPVKILPTLSPAEIAEKRTRRRELVQDIKNLDITALARELSVGELKLRDLLKSLKNPVQDPREDSPAPVFRKGILKYDDLKQGMQLRGQIVNVVDFGVFLNIGIGESCLVHISRLANRFVRDPHWYYSVGDVLSVWVQEVDCEKRRVTLTAIRPESAKRERRKPRPEQAASGRSRNRRDGGRSAAPSSPGKKRHYASRGKPHHKRPRKPKPVTPITDEMVDGKEPMRSFSDLLQFHKRKADDEPKT